MIKSSKASLSRDERSRDERSKGQVSHQAPDRLPAINSSVARRKVAVVKAPSISSASDLPKISKTDGTKEHRISHNESEYVTLKRLDINRTPSPLLLRPLSSKSQEPGKKANLSARRRHLSLQPLSTQPRHSKSPQPERRSLSYGRASEKSTSHNKSVSLEDVLLSYENDPNDMDHFLSCWHEDGTCPWSKYWCFTRRSIGARPEENVKKEFEKLNTALREGLAVTDYRTSGHELELYGVLEPDIMSERPLASTSLSLEERLASIERQHGLPNTI